MRNTSGFGDATRSTVISNGAFLARANISEINVVFMLVGVTEILAHNDESPSAT
jgi:hypothetical protein